MFKIIKKDILSYYKLTIKAKPSPGLTNHVTLGFLQLGRSRRTSNSHPSSSAPRTYSPTYSITTYKMPSPAHLISKIGDPIFAVFIGLSAAATRINREEKELGRSTQQTIDAGLRYALQGLYKIVSKLTLLFNRRIGFRQGDASSKE